VRSFPVPVSRSSYFLSLHDALPIFLLMLPLMWLAVSFFFPYFNIEAGIFNFPMLVLTALLTLASMCIGMLFSIAIPSQLKATERSEEHTSELQSREKLVCRLLLEKK